jgi:hypothetical protein
MSEKLQLKEKEKQQELQLKANDQEAPSKQLAPPPFQLKAEPLQMEDGKGGQQEMPPQLQTNFQLQPPGLTVPGAQQPGLGIPSLQLPQLGGGAGLLGQGGVGSLLRPNLFPQMAPGLAPNMLQQPNQQEQDREFLRTLRQRFPLGAGRLLSDDAVLSLWQVDPLAAPWQDQDGNGRRNADGTPMTQWSQLGPREIDEQAQISRMIMERRHLNLGWAGPLNSQGLGASYQWADGRSFTFGARPTGDGARLGFDYRF